MTVLTSLLEDDLRAEGIEATIPEMVRARARIAARAGHRGAGLLAARDRAARAAAPGLFIVVPGIRPAEGAGSAKGDQKRVATARQAIENGADYLVVGRPVRDAADPAKAFDALVAEVGSGGLSDVAASRDRLRHPPRRGARAARARARSRSSTSPTATARPRSTGCVADGQRSRDHGRVPAAPAGRRSGAAPTSTRASSRSRASTATPSWRRSSLAAPATAAAEPLLLLLLDGITDPHNFGALVRSAEVLGAHGVVVPSARPRR